jgi:hypothetical protein
VEEGGMGCAAWWLPRKRWRRRLEPRKETMGDVGPVSGPKESWAGCAWQASFEKEKK